jgi:hypothetical protein
MKKTRSIGRTILSGVAMAMAMFGNAAEAAAGPVQDAGNAVEQSATKKKISQRQSMPRVQRESKRNSHGQSAYRFQKEGFLNQKEKRQKLRNNPHFRRSKKCTTKIK